MKIHKVYTFNLAILPFVSIPDKYQKSVRKKNKTYTTRKPNNP